MSQSAAWYYEKNGQRCGPYSASQLKQLATAGGLSPTDLVWKESFSDWVSASRVKGLFPPSPVIEAAHAPADPPLLASATDDLAPSDVSAVVPAAVVPPEMPPPITATESVQPAASFAHPTTPAVPASVSATALRTVLSVGLWNQLVAAGFPVDADVFWLPVHSSKVREQSAAEIGGTAMGMLRRMSDKLSTLAETADIQTNRTLIVTRDGQVFVTSQFAASSHAWALPREQYQISNYWNGPALEVTFTAQQPDLPVQSVSCRLDLAKPLTLRATQSPNFLVALADHDQLWQAGRNVHLFPLMLRQSAAACNRFCHQLLPVGNIVWASTDSDSLRFHGEHSDRSIKWDQVLGWKADENSITVLTLASEGVTRLVITADGSVGVEEEANQLKVIEQQLADALEADKEQVDAGLADASAQAVQTPGDGNNSKSVASDAAKRPGMPVLARASMRAIVESLTEHAADRRAKYLLFAGELKAQPLFGAADQRIVMVVCDTQCQVLAGAGELPDLQQQNSFDALLLDESRFLQLDPAGAFQVAIDQASHEVWHALQALPSETFDPRKPSGAVALLKLADSSEPFACLVNESDGGQLTLQLSDPQAEDRFDESPWHVSSISSQSERWTPEFGAVRLQRDNPAADYQLIASNATLIALWETKALGTLKVRTQGVSLGQLYEEYNNSCMQKFLTGVFGNFFLTQQRLQKPSSLDSLIQKIEAAPPGVLDDELEAQLVERLSVLEISRHQLNRWLDRCTLMYPHQRAAMERRWLVDVFGDQLTDPAFRDRESWRVHQQVRAELRQVQASMLRAMNEVGQNLNMVSFAFPEEVRCAALASTRRAAGLAETGAMVAAFGGIGGQLMLGIGRASFGDPLGFAMVGAVGLSLVGKHLEKKAKDTEKKIRLRAYGSQALQWWGVVQETAAVMAVECKHAMRQSQQAAMARDRKLLEKAPPQQLPALQQRMAEAMRDTMQADVGSQFYEALPGSGIFGWHLVDYIADATELQSASVVKSFEQELPGSIGKA